MRKFIGMALCGLLVCLAWPAMSAEARTLEEILKDKGVITAADYAEASRGHRVAYKPGKGLTATSADGKYSFRIGGYAQILYRDTDFDDSTTDNKSDFDTRRFKLQIRGKIGTPKFGYKFQGDVSSGFRTEDVYINYTFSAPFKLQLGQFKPPQSRQELTSAAKQLFPERSLANDTFNLGRDQGIQAAGSLADKMVAYRIGLFNGNGPNIGNADDNHMLAGRIDINPLGVYKMDEAGWSSDTLLVNVGSSFAWEKVGPNDVGTAFGKDNDVMDVALALDSQNVAGFTAAYGTDLTWLLWTANANARWMGAAFAAEYYHLNADPQLGADWDADGYYLQAGYQLIPKTLELAVRYSAIESSDVNASAKFDKNQTQFGANYYFAKHHLKLQSDVTLVSDGLAAQKDDTIVRLQAQFYF